ncbi:NRDE family protein [Candidatus Uhrbacteria bacterium]|nr:NRDE family protein [Candidatus Uhrbacteria bacterium]
MCTVALAWNPGTLVPLLCIANRDEFYDRPSAPPRIHRIDTDLPCIAPQDLRRGGTWIGMNAVRMCAALTNRDGAPPGLGRRSRGQLVPFALAHRSPHIAVEVLRALDPAAFRPFHLVLANPEEAYLLWSDGRTIKERAITPGTLIITQRSLGAAPVDRAVATYLAPVQRFHPKHAQEKDHPQGDLSDALLRSIAAHDPHHVYDGPCVHDDDYGTRSSAMIIVHQDGAMEYHYTDGPPCNAPWQSIPHAVGATREHWWQTIAAAPHAITDPWALDVLP